MLAHNREQAQQAMAAGKQSEREGSAVRAVLDWPMSVRRPPKRFGGTLCLWILFDSPWSGPPLPACCM